MTRLRVGALYMKKTSSAFLIIILCLTIISAILLPFIVNESFKLGKGYVVLWKTADMLAYCGTALSVIATVILSCIAVVNSSKANEVSDRMLKIEEERMTPYLDILREKSNITECKDDDTKLKIKLNIRNLGEYPIQNIYLSRTELSRKELDSLYNKEEIQNKIFEQFEKIESNPKDTSDYNLTCIAGLREMVIIHSETKNGKTIKEEEYTPFSENLFFNIDKKEVDAPIELFVTMQDIAGKIFLQRTKLFIVQRNQDKKYILTMHSKRIEMIEL